jgi:hypothetical protein
LVDKGPAIANPFLWVEDRIMKNEVMLDEAAQELFEALGGIDRSDRVVDRAHAGEDLASALDKEETRMDAWRILLIEFVFRLAAHFKGMRLTGTTGDAASDLNGLFPHLERLLRMPDRGTRILLRFRGMLAGLGDKKNRGLDYVLDYGPVTVDIPIVKAMVNRRGIGASHLPGRLAAAFELFNAMDITTCRLSLREWSDDAREQMRLCLEALGRYFVGISRGLPLLNRDPSVPVPGPEIVFDAHRRPDANLTMLAGVNRMTVASVQALAHKVSLRIHQADEDSPLHRYANVYEAMFAFKNLKERLIRPPIEINNVRWLIAETDEEVIGREKAAVGRLVMEKLGGSPQRAAVLMEGIYGVDFPDLAADALEARLGRVSDFLNDIEADRGNQPVEKEILTRVHERLDQVSEGVFDNLSMADVPDGSRRAKGEGGGWRFNERLLGLLAFFRRRFGTRKKMRQIGQHPVDLDPQDYETIAEDYGIGTEEAKALVDLLKGCFDKEGRFLRQAFEQGIPALARYETKIFEFLWQFLQEIRRREDRVAFLNALQTLIDRMQQRKNALKTVLRAFLGTPGDVSFADRNALILANLLLRKYNKELRMDIEVSPEEILRVRDGLDRAAATDIAMFLNEKREAVFAKVRAIHLRTKEGLDGKRDESALPIRYLLSLERESYIFFSLAGGDVGHRVLCAAVAEYGNPDAEIYHLAGSNRALKGLIQLLRVAVQGLERFKRPEDLVLLQQVKGADGKFYALSKDKDAVYALEGVMKWIGKAMEQGGRGLQNTIASKDAIG